MLWNKPNNHLRRMPYPEIGELNADYFPIASRHGTVVIVSSHHRLLGQINCCPRDTKFRRFMGHLMPRPLAIRDGARSAIARPAVSTIYFPSRAKCFSISIR